MKLYQQSVQDGTVNEEEVDDDDEEDESHERGEEGASVSGTSKDTSPEAKFIFRRMGRAAANGTPSQRNAVLLWCAAATAALGAEGVTAYLQVRDRVSDVWHRQQLQAVPTSHIVKLSAQQLYESMAKQVATKVQQMRRLICC